MWVENPFVTVGVTHELEGLRKTQLVIAHQNHFGDTTATSAEAGRS